MASKEVEQKPRFCSLLMLVLVVAALSVLAICQSVLSTAPLGQEPSAAITHLGNKESTLSNPNRTEGYKLMGFTDEMYLDHAIRWFNELIKLGYSRENVVVAAVDNATLRELQSRNITSQLCLLEVGKQQLQRYRRSLFAARWRCILHELRDQGNHVVLTDVDNIFTRFVPIVETFSQWNVIHAYGNGFPVRFQKLNGFTVCGGMSWLQAHPSTVRYVQLIVQNCGVACDDQVVINSLWSTLNVEWTIDEHEVDSTLGLDSNWMQPVSSRHGRSNVTNHSVSIWNRHFAYRGPLEAKPCPDPSVNWVAMPSNEQGKRKVQLWGVHCPRAKGSTTMT